MAETAETAGETEEKHSRSWDAIIFWPVAILIFYVLSIGPLVMLVDKGWLTGKGAEVLESLYRPLEWAYKQTLLHRPIGMYLHLWSKRFDKKGDQKN